MKINLIQLLIIISKIIKKLKKFLERNVLNFIKDNIKNNQFKCIITIECDIFQENESLTVQKTYDDDTIRDHNNVMKKYKYLLTKYYKSCKIEVNNHIFTMKTSNDFLKFLNLLNEILQKFNVSFSFNDTNLFCNKKINMTTLYFCIFGKIAVTFW